MNTFQKITLMFTSFFVLAVPAFAQMTPISTPYASTSGPLTNMGPGPVVLCSTLTTNLHYGEHDGIMPKEVSILQDFLNQKGYLSVSATGYFGSLTLQAVKSFQSQNGLQADGVVGPMTRAKITMVACPSTITHPVTTAPIITALTPSAGPTGTTITITGTGFTNSNIVHFSVGGVGNLTSGIVPVASSMNGTVLQAISFTVPSSIGAYCKPTVACPMYALLLTPGTYPISVENDNGTSNVMQFTITQ